MQAGPLTLRFWALLLKGQKGGGQSKTIPAMLPSAIATYYWPG